MTKEWRCKDCGYVQDFEPTPESMMKHFKTQDTGCPSCKDCKEFNVSDKD